MGTFEEEAVLREREVPVAAEALFSRPLFKVPQFTAATALGFVAVGLDIRLSIAAVNGIRLRIDTLLWPVGCILVSAWFGAASHLEDVRASYLNETTSTRDRGTALSIALMSDFRVTLGGLTALYVTVIVLELAISRLLIGTGR